MTPERKQNLLIQRVIELSDHAQGADPVKRLEYWYCRVSLDGATEENVGEYLAATELVNVAAMEHSDEEQLNHIARMTTTVCNAAMSEYETNGMDMVCLEQKLIAYNPSFASFFNNKNGLVVESDGSIKSAVTPQPVC